MPRRVRITDERRYLALAALLVVGYAVLGPALWAGKDFGDRGPLSYFSPGATSVPAGVVPAQEALTGCFPDRIGRSPGDVVLAAEVQGQWFWACYDTLREGRIVSRVAVVDARAAPVTDVDLLKAAGVWPWIGVVDTAEGLLTAGLGVVGLPILGWVYYRRPRPGPPSDGAGPRSWWHLRGAAVALLVPIPSWISFAVTRRISRARKVRILLQAVLVLAACLIGPQLMTAFRIGDPWGMPATAVLAAAFLLATVGGWTWLAHPDFGRPDDPWSPPRALPAAEGVRPGPPPAPADAEHTAGRLRRFRAAARNRAVLSTTIRVVAITIAVIAAWFVIGLTASSVLDPRLRSSVAAALLLFAVTYGIFFVLPGAVAAVLALPMILGWRDPARILLLRPFNRADHSRPLRGLARRELAGYGHVYTLADVAITVRWFVAVPVLLGQLGVLSFRLGPIRGPTQLHRLARTVAQVRRRNVNWAVARSKVFAVRCTDEVWQPAVRQMAESCDAVLIDASTLTGNLVWELELLRELGRLDDCVVLALHDEVPRAAVAIARQLGRSIPVLGFDRRGRMLSPREFRDTLAAILFRRVQPTSHLTPPVP